MAACNASAVRGHDDRERDRPRPCRPDREAAGRRLPELRAPRSRAVARASGRFGAPDRQAGGRGRHGVASTRSASACARISCASPGSTTFCAPACGRCWTERARGSALGVGPPMEHPDRWPSASATVGQDAGRRRHLGPRMGQSRRLADPLRARARAVASVVPSAIRERARRSPSPHRLRPARPRRVGQAARSRRSTTKAGAGRTSSRPSSTASAVDQADPGRLVARRTRAPPVSDPSRRSPHRRTPFRLDAPVRGSGGACPGVARQHRRPPGHAGRAHRCAHRIPARLLPSPAAGRRFRRRARLQRHRAAGDSRGDLGLVDRARGNARRAEPR